MTPVTGPGCDSAPAARHVEDLERCAVVFVEQDFEPRCRAGRVGDSLAQLQTWHRGRPIIDTGHRTLLAQPCSYCQGREKMGLEDSADAEPRSSKLLSEPTER